MSRPGKSKQQTRISVSIHRRFGDFISFFTIIERKNTCSLGRGGTQSKSSSTDEPEDIGYLMTNVKYFCILLRFFRTFFDSKFLDFCVVIIETSLAHTAQAGQLPVQNIDLLCQLLSHVPGLAGAELICTVSSRNAAL